MTIYTVFMCPTLIKRVASDEWRRRTFRLTSGWPGCASLERDRYYYFFTSGDQAERSRSLFSRLSIFVSYSFCRWVLSRENVPETTQRREWRYVNAHWWNSVVGWTLANLRVFFWTLLLCVFTHAGDCFTMPVHSLGVVFIELQTFNIRLYLLSQLRFEREQVEQMS